MVTRMSCMYACTTGRFLTAAPHPCVPLGCLSPERIESCFTWECVRVKVNRVFAEGRYRLGMNLESFAPVAPYGCFVRSILAGADQTVHVSRGG